MKQYTAVINRERGRWEVFAMFEGFQKELLQNNTTLVITANNFDEAYAKVTGKL